MFGRRHQTPQPIATGSLLNNRYRLLEQIGEGGAGVIYKAEDEQLKRIIAIKLLLASGTMDGDKRARFQSEAQSVARLNHTNIITLYDYAEEHNQPYLVIEYIPGEDLWELDNNYAPNLMPFEESLPVIDGILAALEYSHAHHVIHRDLKPENVMITPDKQVKVMDFGLARIEGQSRLTQDGLVAGTAAYLAPELAMGEPGDHRVDLYATGVIMYELLTGRRPFAGEDPLTIISQHIHAPVVPPQHYNPAISNDIQQIILKLLAKKPKERYDIATSVRTDLARVLTNMKSGVPSADITKSQSQDPTFATDPQTLLERINRGQMMGRENELEQLKGCWDLVRLGEYQKEPLLLISGEGGIGKTRLLRELQVYTGLRDGYILHGVAHELDTGKPYAIFANTLSNYIAEQPAEVLYNQMSGFIAGEVVKLVPALTEKLGSIQPNPPLEPSAERARLLAQISKFILNIAAEHPTLLVLDELHFADPGSLDILDILTRQTIGTSLLIAGAYRDVALSYTNPTSRLINALEGNKLLHNMTLRRLPQNMVKQMLEALLDNNVSRKFVRSIYQATEGNPFFVEELIKSLAVDGQIALHEGRWEQQHTNLIHVPGSIRAVLGKRLDHIKKQALELLQLAATIGRSFELDLLLEASPYNDDVIQWSIEDALRAQLIEVVKITEPNDTSPEIDIHYQFQHALIRETLYEDLRPLRRRHMHRRVAAAMGKLAADNPIDNPAILAHHFIEGAEDEKAAPYLRLAGDRAYQFYANEEALEYFSQACEILEDIAPDLVGKARQSNLAERFDLLNLQRNIVDIMGDRGRELAVLETLQELAEIMADKAHWVEVMCRMSTYYWHVGQLNAAEETARRALKVARNNNNERGEQYALERIARVFWTRRDASAMKYATRSFTLAQEAGDRPREGRLTELIGNIYTDTLRDPDRASIFFNQALDISRETQNRYEEAWTLWGMGGLSMLTDNYTLAQEHYIQARQIAEEIGASLQVGWDLYGIGNAWYHLGGYRQALDYYKQSQAIFNVAQHSRGQIRAKISLGVVFTTLGDWKEAANHLNQAEHEAEERHDQGLMFRSYKALSTYYRLLEGEDNLTHAIRFSNRIIQLTNEGGYFEQKLLGHYLRAVSFLGLRDLPKAFESSAKAIALLEQYTYIESSQITAAEVYYAHSRIFAAMGQMDTAQTYLKKAYAETLRKANLIADEQLRFDFLNLVLINQKIMRDGQRQLPT